MANPPAKQGRATTPSSNPSTANAKTRPTSSSSSGANATGSAAPKGGKGGKVDPKKAKPVEVEVDDDQKFVACTVLEEYHVQDLFNSPVTDLPGKLSRLMALPNWKEDLQSNIYLSLYISNILFAKQNDFNTVQTIAFFSIMKSTLETAIEKAMNLKQCIAFLKELLLKSTSLRLPNSDRNNDNVAPTVTPVFGLREMKLITEYATNGIFQHYKLYMHVFTTEQEKLEVDYTVEIELPMKIEPLVLGKTLAEWEAEQEMIRMDQERIQMEKNKLLEEARKAAQNPFDALSNEEIQHIAIQTITDLLGNISVDVEHHLEDMTKKVMVKLGQVEG